jgi:hypothetical protein
MMMEALGRFSVLPEASVVYAVAAELADIDSSVAFVTPSWWELEDATEARPSTLDAAALDACVFSDLAVLEICAYGVGLRTRAFLFSEPSVQLVLQNLTADVTGIVVGACALSTSLTMSSEVGGTASGFISADAVFELGEDAECEWRRMRSLVVADQCLGVHFEQGKTGQVSRTVGNRQSQRAPYAGRSHFKDFRWNAKLDADSQWATEKKCMTSLLPLNPTNLKAFVCFEIEI